MTTFTNKGYKIAAQFSFSFWVNFALLNRIFWVLAFLTPFNGLFAPNSQSPRFSEFLGKINEKKWSQIRQLLLMK